MNPYELMTCRDCYYIQEEKKMSRTYRQLDRRGGRKKLLVIRARHSIWEIENRPQIVASEIRMHQDGKVHSLVRMRNKRVRREEF